MRFNVGDGSDEGTIDAFAVYAESGTYLFMSIVPTAVYADYEATVNACIASIHMEMDS